MNFAIPLAISTFISTLRVASTASTNTRHYVTFSLPEPPSTAIFERLASVNENLYIAYYNDGINVYGEDEENDEVSNASQMVLDNVNPGLSILYLPKSKWGVWDASAYPHTVGSSSAWCLTLVTLFISGKWRNSESLGEYTAPLDTFYHRCVSLNYQWNAETTSVYEELLHNLPKGFDLEDVYLFEKWSKRSPTPLYADEKELVLQALDCYCIHGRMPLHEPKVSWRHCFLNDLLGIEWSPHASPRSGSADHADSSTEAPRYWHYLHAPKLMDLSLKLNNAIVDSCRLLASFGSSPKHKKIMRFLNENLHTIKLHYAIGSISSRGGYRQVNFSFAMSFLLERPVDFSAFDYVAVDTNALAASSTILSHLDPLIHSKEIVNKLDYFDFQGNGQHRSWRVSVTLDTGVLRKLTAPGNRIIIKVVHMLDSSVYLDRDELKYLFKRIEKEELSRIPTARVNYRGLGLAAAELRTIRTSRVNIEDPEQQSAPVIYYGYVAMEPSVLTFAKVRVYYRLPIHTRYMPMKKKATSCLEELDIEKRLMEMDLLKYDMAILHEPQVYILKTSDYPPPSMIPRHVKEYIAFRRGISFLSMVSIGRTDMLRLLIEQKKQNKKTKVWHRLYFTERPKSRHRCHVCRRGRTGAAIITNMFSLAQCPFQEPRTRVVECQQTYVSFSIPVGDQNDILSAITVALIASAAIALISLNLVSKKIVIPFKLKAQ